MFQSGNMKAHARLLLTETSNADPVCRSRFVRERLTKVMRTACERLFGGSDFISFQQKHKRGMFFGVLFFYVFCVILFPLQ